MASSRYRKIKVRSTGRKKILIFLIAISLLFVSSGYSILNSELGFSGTLIVNQYNTNDVIRVSNVELIDKKNNGNEINKPSYSSDRTAMHVTLPNTNSSVTYRVTVTNETGNYFSPNEINAITISNNNVKYSITGIESYGIYSGNSITFNITFTTSLANQESSVILKYDFKEVNEMVWTFSTTGSEQEFVAPYKADYKMEAWGAQGGGDGGLGGYTSGKISLNGNTKMYVYVGGAGTSEEAGGKANIPGGYNGGGSTTNQNYKGRTFSSGGGATDIRLVNGTWNNFDSLKSRIMVAAGGGGKFTSEYPDRFISTVGHGGGLNGLDCIISETHHGLSWGENTIGASQTEGGYCLGGSQWNYSSDHRSSIGKFGIGANSTHYGTGGGGGYYGGGGSLHVQSASGGSSFISGYTGCNAISKDSTENNIIHLGTPIHYSGYEFKNMSLIAGNGVMPTHDGKSTMTGNSGDGYFKITLILE